MEIKDIALVENNLEADLLSGQLSISDNFERVGNKTGGANSPGKAGGLYKRKTPLTNAPEILFKQDTARGGKRNTEKDIAEVVGGMLLKAIAGEYAATVGFIRYDSKKEKIDESGENTYVGSVLLKNCIDLYIHVYQQAGLPVPSDRPRFGRDLKLIANTVAQGQYIGFEKVSIGSLLIRDFDLHSGNLMVETNELTLKRIDFGGSLKGLEDHLDPHSLTEHLPGFGPINHYCDYPTKVRVNKAIADEMERVSTLDLRSTINNAIEYAGKFYGIKPMVAFAKRLGVPSKPLRSLVKVNDKASLLDATKMFLATKIENRQRSLTQIALEIRIDISIKKNKQGEFEIGDDLVDLALDNQAYFNERLKDKKFHFRAEEHKGAHFFDRLFGFTRRKITKRLIEKTELIFDKTNKPKLEKIKILFSSITNNLLRHALTEKLYSKVFAGSLEEEWPEETITNIIKEINNLFPKEQPVKDITRDWLMKFCGEKANNNIPSELKEILKEIAKNDVSKNSSKSVTILHLAITQHNLNLPHAYLRDNAFYLQEELISLQEYNRQTVSPLLHKIDPSAIARLANKNEKKGDDMDIYVCKGKFQHARGMFESVEKNKIETPEVSKTKVSVQEKINICDRRLPLMIR